MNKTAIKNFSIWARNKLIADISYRAGLMGITETGITDPLPQSTDTMEFYDIGTADPYTISGIEARQRKDLVDAIHRKEADSDYETAYSYIIEEVAYTWFNRLIAVRFMEVNDYLPSHIRVLSSEGGKMEPDLVASPFDANLEFTAEEEKQIINLKRENALDEVFRLLFIKQCNAINSILPGLFEKTGDYTEILLNLSVTDRDGVIYHLVHDIDEADFDIETKDENGNTNGQVEIIGWLYQYYNTEPKDETFALLKKNIKITKERIPSATQLFTPDWIVRFMVENSLGRLWVEGHPNNELKASWQYYLNEAEQEPDVEVQLAEIRKKYSSLSPEDIKIIDPCMGSGHILVYAFDVLMQIYETQGFTKQDAVKNILENNLYGLDIDERAAQLAYFAVMMKARSYDRRFFYRDIHPHIYAIQESNELSDQWLSGNEQIQILFDFMKDAKELGSIIVPTKLDYNSIRNSIRNRFDGTGQVDFEADELQRQLPEVITLVDVAEILSQNYNVVITNPPYMGASNMDKELSEFIKRSYPDGKSDLFACFIERGNQMVKEYGYNCMVTMQSWMFLSSFENLRVNILATKNITNLMHMDNMVLGIAFGTAVTVFQNCHLSGYKGTYNYITLKDIQKDKPKEFPVKGNRFAQVSTDNFSEIPGSPVAYWCSHAMLNVFTNGVKIGTVAACRKGLVTGNDNLYLKLWYEISANNFSVFSGWNTKWKPINKGGKFRKWFGNNEYVVNWGTDGKELANHRWPNGRQRSSLRNSSFFFRKAITWTYITSSANCFRYYPDGFAFAGVGPGMFPLCQDNLLMMLSYCNSVVFNEIEKMIGASTISLETGEVERSPIIMLHDHSQIDRLTKECIILSKKDWDSFEISWEFKRHPLMHTNNIAEAFAIWETKCDDQFSQLKFNEEELNRIFIEIYGLQDELSPEVADKDVTVRKADLQRDVRSFLSYAVGCMFGRYSLDMDGLAYAGGDWDDSKYTSFKPDADDIIPITDEEYLEDDIVSCLCQWLKNVYDEETLEENLDFIAQALGNKGDSSRDVIRNYFLKDFFADHCKIFQKRPIYWLFDSGKQNGFKALVYLHRYTPDTVGNLRIDYLHRMQRIYDGEIIRMQDTIDHSDNSREVTKATKRKEKLQKQLKECQEYDEKISHLALSRIELDLDDGVKVNYEKLQTAQDGKKYQVLAKI